MSESTMHKVSMWGNAVSISDHKPETYARNITLRYPVYCPFSGGRISLTFDNYCGNEDVLLTKATVLYNNTFTPVTFGQRPDAPIPAGMQITSDEIDINVNEGDTLIVSFYFKDFTLMRSSVYVSGPLSSGQFAVGDFTQEKDFPIELSRSTNIFYFLSDISIYTDINNKALVCYGDSITAQDWPDYLQLLLKEKGIRNISVIRKATSGSRILRQYDNITYESYGLKGKNRFTHELPVNGAFAVILQQGINDIIHPVGTDINPFRPMSDLPTANELFAGFSEYIRCAKEMGLKVYGGTLLPIEGWRTYADFREELKNKYNEMIRNEKLLDGYIDFDLYVRDEANPKAFKKSFDSGDHLHPSAEGYKAMAYCAYEKLLTELSHQ